MLQSLHVLIGLGGSIVVFLLPNSLTTSVARSIFSEKPFKSQNHKEEPGTRRDFFNDKGFTKPVFTQEPCGNGSLLRSKGKVEV